MNYKLKSIGQNQMGEIRTIFNSVAEVWILMDTEGNVLLSSKQMERFSHLFTPPIGEGSNLFESISPSWLPLAKNVLQSLLHSTSPSILETSLTDTDGKEIFFEIKSAAIRNSDGEATQIFTQAIDVTPQKIFEKKITIVAREYQSVIE